VRPPLSELTLNHSLRPADKKAGETLSGAYGVGGNLLNPPASRSRSRRDDNLLAADGCRSSDSGGGRVSGERGGPADRRKGGPADNFQRRSRGAPGRRTGGRADWRTTPVPDGAAGTGMPRSAPQVGAAYMPPVPLRERKRAEGRPGSGGHRLAANSAGAGVPQSAPRVGAAYMPPVPSRERKRAEGHPGSGAWRTVQGPGSGAWRTAPSVRPSEGGTNAAPTQRRANVSARRGIPDPARGGRRRPSDLLRAA
jgi:hypothetical protein